MKVFTSLFLAIMSMFLVGCASNTPMKETVYVNKYIYVKVPTQLTKRIIPEKPISKDSYMAMSFYEREDYLSTYVVKLIGDVRMCNNQLDKIEKIQGVVDDSKQTTK